MTHFGANDRCHMCKKLILTEHESFLFNNCPDAIRLHPNEPEWQPCPETRNIPFDKGPHRVAYVWGKGNDVPKSNVDHIGDPVVMVYEGPLEAILWVPCNAVTLEHYGTPSVWLWYCQPVSPKNPVTDDFMRSISS